MKGVEYEFVLDGLFGDERNDSITRVHLYTKKKAVSELLKELPVILPASTPPIVA